MSAQVNLMLTSLAFLGAFLAVGFMGYAIQRGGTCTVAAVDEIVTRHRATRLAGMVEASLWVAGGIALLHGLGRLPIMPMPYAVTSYTILGGALLGLGAWVSGACVFGAIARFGSGEWAYVATPLGYFAGCTTIGLFAMPAAMRLHTVSPVLRFPLAVALLFAAFALWRVLPALRRPRTIAARVWAPHAATSVIGVTFLVALLLAGGTWAYTDVLADLARGMPRGVGTRSLLLLALFGGALAGGWTAGRLKPARPRASHVLRCFAGGVLMAWGSLLIPGANDGLILIGMPMLWPYAWLAFASMCVAIAGAMLARRALPQVTLRRSTP
ncbi:MAG TPA: YeeE/YedE thiosulfate transporter family protein [Burkholderiaceae bacterium]|nr:YeeE/YedE thiosulfate transporter family protein [Burkholderiaceae bacterium]